MNAEVRAALDKYRSLEYRGLGNWYTPDGELLDQEDVTKLRAILAEAYLEEHPADDEEPITREWLVEIGAKDVGFNVLEIGYLRFLKAEDGTGPDVRPWSHIASYKGQVIETVLNTRGQLRDLLKVLGIKH